VEKQERKKHVLTFPIHSPFKPRERDRGILSDLHLFNIAEQANRQEIPERATEPAYLASVTTATQTPMDSIERRSGSDTNESPERFYYSLHIESCKNLQDARKRAKLLIREGQYAWWKKVNITGKGEWYRVYIGKRNNKTEALNFAKTLKAQGIIDYFSVHKLRDR